MAIDSSIPLQINPQPDFLTQQRNMLSLRDMALRFKQDQAADQAQNALRQIFANPTNLDEKTGFPTSTAMNQIMAIDPNTGMQLRQNQLRSEQLNLSIAGQKSEFQQKLADLSQRLIRDPSLIAYEEARRSGQPEQVAQTMAQRAYSDGLEEFKRETAGLVSNDQMAVVPTDFNYGRVKQKSMAYKDYQAQQQKGTPEEQALAQFRKENPNASATQERDFIVSMKREERGASEQGWVVLTDPTNKDKDGNPTQYRYNPRTAQATTLSGQPYTAGGAAKLGSGSGQFTDKMGSLMAALAEQGVSLPTGFRSKEQQAQLYKGILERYPDKSVDEIARQIKTGQIEFAAQKKETQTAAGIAGKVEVAQNEIEEFTPLVRSASAKVGRIKFVPINQLLQMGESNISDPDLKRLRIYINSTLNAYDVLAARGGTDKDKRAETRALLTSADGPEALEAGLQAFEIEAAAAHRAAVKATKVPELPEQAGSPKPQPSNAGAAGGGIVTTYTEADYNRLPSGAKYRMTDDKPGAYRVKP